MLNNINAKFIPVGTQTVIILNRSRVMGCCDNEHEMTISFTVNETPTEIRGLWARAVTNKILSTMFLPDIVLKSGHWSANQKLVELKLIDAFFTEEEVKELIENPSKYANSNDYVVPTSTTIN